MALFSILKIERRSHMEKSVLIREMMWEYNYTKYQATNIVEQYEKQGEYDSLCELVIAKKQLSHVTK